MRGGNRSIVQSNICMCEPGELKYFDWSLKLLKQFELVICIIISNYLKWNHHVDSVVRKAAKRIYFLRQLRRAKVPITDMLWFYCTCIRSVVEYASPVFHYALPNLLSDDLERIQRRAFRIILHGPWLIICMQLCVHPDSPPCSIEDKFHARIFSMPSLMIPWT